MAAKSESSHLVQYRYLSFYSIQLQAVENKGEFLVIFVGYPGSVQDSRVFKNIPLICHKLYSPGICLILGDGGYISANLPNNSI